VQCNLGRAVRDQGDAVRAAFFYCESLSNWVAIGNTLFVSPALVGLLGAAERGRDAAGAPVWPLDEDRHARDVAATRDALGDAAFADAWASGRRLSAEQLLAEAMLIGAGESAGDDNVAAETGTVTTGLTTRELEVLRLLAAGFSNPKIAEELVIERSTVRTHVINIYRKLDVSSRAEATTYAHIHSLLLSPQRPPA